MSLSRSLPSPSPTIMQWEEASETLLAAFRSYVNLCVNLGTDSLREGATSKDLVSRIDSTLATVHTDISHHLGESRSALALTRNKLASPLFRLPEEIMLEIFMNVIFSRNDRKSSKPPSSERSTRMVYCQLYILIRVCSVWKDLILARGGLWSVIPIIEGHSDKKHAPASIILQRSGESPLHLSAFMTRSVPSRLVKVLSDYGPRFRTVSFRASSRFAIRDILSRLLKHGTSGSLSELSIQYDNASLVNRTPQESDYIIPHDHLDYPLFASLLKRLTVLRLSGILFHLDTVSLSFCLVELRIERLVLGCDNTVVPFVRALSSAPNLRDLKIISVSTFRNLNATRAQNSLELITFANLKSLLLQDLYFNTLGCLIPTVSPGSYKLTLFLTRKSLEINALRNDALANEDMSGIEPELVGVNELGRALARTSVDTLTIVGARHNCWLTGSELRNLLTSMPTIKTLKMSHWALDHSFWRAMRRSPVAQSRPDGSLFPSLENLHFYSARMINQRGFRNMVSSHPIQKVVLGSVYNNWADELSKRGSCGEDDNTMEWLKHNIPTFRLVSSTYEPPEFHLEA